MRILITGGAGFIGSHLADAYTAQGHEVAVVDSLVSGKLENLKQSLARFYHVDITDQAALMDAFASFRPDVVSHHAAQMSVKVSVDRPLYDAHVNVIGLLNVLEASVRHGAKKVIFASSGGTVYGDALQTPTPEDAPLAPLSPYGITKMVAEHYLRFYASEHGLRTTTFRYGNVYGPRQDPHGEAGVVAIFARKLLAGAAPVIHWDGEQEKDYVHVRDVARANLLALTAGDGATLNIGSGEGTSVNRLFEAARAHLGADIAPAYGPKRPGDVRRSVIDVAEAERVLGWTPQVGLAEGMIDTLAFFKAQHAASALTR